MSVAASPTASMMPIGAIDFPPGSPYFAGHFPDRPIVPGITELQLAVEALARHAGVPPLVAALHSARLKRIVGPGERVDVFARAAAAGRHRLELRVGDEVAAQADVTLGAPVASDDTALDPVVGAPPANLPSLDALMPHRPPMRFPTRVVAVSDDGLAAEARIPAKCALVRDGSAGALVCVEAAAQAAALWEGVRRFAQAPADAGPRVGYLVALRDLVFDAGSIAAATPFDVTIRLDAVAMPLTHYRIEARQHGRPIVRGRVATVLAPTD